MKKYLIATAPVAMLLAGGTALSADEGGDVVTPPASEFSPIQRYAISYDKPRDIAEFYVADFGINLYDAKFEELDHPGDTNMRVMLVTVDEVDDSAVKSVQWRFGLRSDAGGWEVEEAGMRRKCRRGTNTDDWTRDVCP